MPLQPLQLPARSLLLLLVRPGLQLLAVLHAVLLLVGWRSRGLLLLLAGMVCGVVLPLLLVRMMLLLLLLLPAMQLCRQHPCRLLLLLLLHAHAMCMVLVLLWLAGAIVDGWKHAVRSRAAWILPTPSCCCRSRHSRRRCCRHCCQMLRQHASHTSCCCISCASTMPHAAGACGCLLLL
jgi:hypothetical protein